MRFNNRTFYILFYFIADIFRKFSQYFKVLIFHMETAF